MLFFALAVSMEDFVLSAPVIELIWRSCRKSMLGGTKEGPSDEDEDELGMRLQVRQMTQLLLDRSLLMGSSTRLARSK